MAGCRTHFQGRKISFILLALLFLGACAEESNRVSLTPQESLTTQCQSAIVPNKYVVYWKDGRISQVSAKSDDEFMKKHVQPNEKSLRKVDRDYYFQLSTKLTDGQMTSNFNLYNWGYENVEAEAAWESGYKGEDVIVAVIDSGVDTAHSLLQNQIYINPGEAGALANNGVDDDNNGYIDDAKGYDFLNGTATVTDDLGHGTHVAGVIAAEHNQNSFTQNVLLSVAPKAKIMPLKFIGNFGGTLGAALEAMEYAASNGAKIINASWGGPGCSDILQDKIIEMGQRGVLFITAAGNSGNNLDVAPEYPAAFSNTTQITVGSITNFNGMSSFSNYSDSFVHLFAPGSDIVSTYPNQTQEYLDGTSMAAPFVAGAAALVAAAKPNWSPTQIRSALLNSVTQSSIYRSSTQGRLNIRKLVEGL